MSDQFLTIEDLVFDYTTSEGSQRVLDGINFVQKKNEWVALIGPNGAGKTSLGLLIKGLLHPTKGSIRMFCESAEEDVRERNAHVGYLFSNPRDQICSITVRDDIAFGLIQKGLPENEIQKNILEAMDALGISHLANHLTHRISGGQLQKVALAGLIAMKPEYIILDEPGSFLDLNEKKEFLQIIRKLHTEGISILYISTSWDEVSMADKVTVLNHGKIYCSCTPEKLLTDEDALAIAGFSQPEIYLLAKELEKYCPFPEKIIQRADQLAKILISQIQ